MTRMKKHSDKEVITQKGGGSVWKIIFWNLKT